MLLRNTEFYNIIKYKFFALIIMHLSSLKCQIASLTEAVSRSTGANLNEGPLAESLLLFLKREGFFVKEEVTNPKIGPSPQHPSILIYSAVSKALYFSAKKGLSIRQSLINLIDQNLKVRFRSNRGRPAATS